MKNVSCYYFITASGKAPVKEFLDSLDVKSQAKFFFVMELLETYGCRLPQPHAKYLGNQIFELRFGGIEGAIRILYFFFHQDKAIFTNGFIKKTQKTPEREKDLAMERRLFYLESQ